MAGKEPRVLRSSSTSGPSTQKCSKSSSSNTQSRDIGASPALKSQEEGPELENLNIKKLMCHDCKKEVLVSLLNMDDSTYESINTLANWGVRWHCPSCLSVPPDTSDPTAEMQEFKISVQQEIQAMTTKVEAQLSLFQTSVSSVVDAACQRETTEVTKSLTSYASVMTKNLDKQSKTAEDVVALKENLINLNDTLESDAEKKLIKLKDMNICLYNVPESPKTDPTESIKDDIIKLKQILDPHTKIEKEDVSQVWRVGEKDPSKTRPAVMKFNNATTRMNVLKLRDLTYAKEGEEDTETISIYTAPDRTIRQRKIHKKLVEELRQRKGAGETNIHIRNYKIVKFSQPFRGQPQINWG